MTSARSRATGPKLSGSLLGAMAIAEGLEIGVSMGRYRVTVGQARRRGQAQTFLANTFWGNERVVDFADAFELGGFDVLVVERTRGRISNSEAGKLLRQIVFGDLAVDFPEWFLSIGREPKQLVLHRVFDFQHAGRRSWAHFCVYVMRMLRLCGCCPKAVREQAHSGFCEIELHLDGERMRLAVPGLGMNLHHLRRKDVRMLTAPSLLVPERQATLVRKLEAEGKRLIAIPELLKVLHEARIRTIETE